jgi:hypothetical protein
MWRIKPLPLWYAPRGVPFGSRRTVIRTAGASTAARAWRWLSTGSDNVYPAETEDV